MFIHGITWLFLYFYGEKAIDVRNFFHGVWLLISNNLRRCAVNCLNRSETVYLANCFFLKRSWEREDKRPTDHWQKIISCTIDNKVPLFHIHRCFALLSFFSQFISYWKIRDFLFKVIYISWSGKKFLCQQSNCFHSILSELHQYL